MQRDHHRRSRTAAMRLAAVMLGLAMLLGATVAAVAAPLPAELLPATLTGIAEVGSPAAALATDPVAIPVFGANRYLTAVEASKQFGPTDAVVIATGESFPDALGGAALAGALQAPILLTPPADVPDAVMAEIDRLDPSVVYVLGGEGAVSAAAFAELDSAVPGTPVRLGGKNRYETAALVAEATTEILGEGWDGGVFVATGLDFPDALAAGPVMYAKGMPLVLVDASGGFDLPAGTDWAKVLGGTSAVPASAQLALGDLFDGRIAGANRYETAKEVAEYGVASGLSWESAGVATGESFPDALCAGPLVGEKGAVLLLTASDGLSEDAADALIAAKGDITEYYLFGGVGALSQDVRDEIAEILKAEEPTFTELHALPDVFCADAGCHDSDLASVHLDARTETGKLVACSACHGRGIVPARECETCHVADEVHVSLHEPAVVPEGCAGEGCHAGTNLLPIHDDSTCETCHGSTDASVVAAIAAGDLSCAACHGENAGDHASLHESALVADCAGCHDANLVVEHEALGCAACHASSDPAVTAAIAAGDLACTACHGPDAGNHGPLHDSTLAAGCTGCHNANLVTEHEPLTCATCHESADPAVAAAIAAGTLDCAACHGDGAGIHGSLHDSSLAVDCAGCHDANLVTEHAGYDCAVCHASADPDVVAAIAAGNLACTACHGVDAGNHGPLHDSALSAGCTGCHDANLVTEHEPLSCATCHESVDPAVAAAIATGNLDCIACHGGDAGAHKAVHTSALAPACAECHQPNLVDEHEGYDCAVCHASTDPNVTAAIAAGNLACTACHGANAGDHFGLHASTLAVDCAGCHDANLVTEHQPLPCATCHESADPAVVAAIAAGNLACTACHGPDAGNHLSLHASTINTGCASCHNGNLVTEHDPLPCATCHESVDPAVQIAIATGNLACTACHGLDAGNHLSLHDSEIAGCGECHNGNLVTEHEAQTLDCATCHESVDPAVQSAITTGNLACSACHNLAEHPYAEAQHTANVGALTISGTIVSPTGVPFTRWDGSVQTFSGQACGQCHSMDLMTEHTKPSSSVAAEACNACHPSPRDTFVSWNDTCQQSGCHAGTLHTEMATKHAWSYAGTSWGSCGTGSTNCHGSEWAPDLAALHEEVQQWGTLWVDTSAYTDGCGFCHAASSAAPSATMCTSCHPAGHSAAPLP